MRKGPEQVLTEIERGAKQINSKFEFRNSKQIQMIKKRKFQTSSF